MRICVHAYVFCVFLWGSYRLEDGKSPSGSRSLLSLEGGRRVKEEWSPLPDPYTTTAVALRKEFL